jgi:predicted nuclease of predicted toxin-antitoxin system
MCARIRPEDGRRMTVKLLLDENISPKVALDLWADGIDAIAVRDRKMLEATDREVFQRAYDEDRIVVTKNVGDFELLASTCELHAGVILLERNDLLRAEQLDVIRRAIVEIEQRGDMVNTVLRVAIDGSMTFEPVPAAG